MREEIINLLNEWKTELEKNISHNGIYLFGSLVNNKGLQFKKDESDVDLVILMPKEVEEDFIKRRDWVASLMPLKISLEKKLMFLIGRKDAGDQIVSLLPVTSYELEHDIHKEGKKPFFRITNFIEIGSEKVVKGEDFVGYKDFGDSFLEQVFSAVQKSRNRYLKSSPIGNLDELIYNEKGKLPKALCREGGKVNSYLNTVDTGDRLSVAFGFDLIKNEVRQRITEGDEFELIYYWCCSSENGLEELGEENVLLLYELLYDLALNVKLNAINKTEFEIYKIKIEQGFSEFLDDTDLLSKSHPSEKKLGLRDIWIDPRIGTYDDLREFQSSIKSSEFVKNFIGHGKVLLAGEDQAGKTAYCKHLFRELVEQNYFPVYLHDKGTGYAGNVENMVRVAFETQLITEVPYEAVDKERIVPIVDDFHFAKDKKKLINALNAFPNHLLVVDDVFELSFSNEMLIKSYDHFNILELTEVQRFELVEKWIDLTIKKNPSPTEENERLAQIDRLVEVVETTLGKLLGGGIMPSHPFFILSVISTYEAANSSKKEITSQGHCYYALIYLYLTNDGVKDEDFDDYLNFLSELAYKFYDEKSEELTPEKFEEFIEYYDEEFNMTVELEEMMAHLFKTNIVRKNSIGNYEFCYPYLYYYFVGKYFADNYSKEEEEIEDILNNLHNNDPAYIAVFISHHSKNEHLVEKLLDIADNLFKDFDEATLSKGEMDFFDEQIELISAAVLPSETVSNIPVEERKKRLEEKEKLKQRQVEALEVPETGSGEIVARATERAKELGLELRRSIKTVQVMGRIIKNRSGSLRKKDELIPMFEKGMNIHLRIIKSFIELISIPEAQLEIVDFISKRIDNQIEEKGINPTKEGEIKKLSKEIFWNTNFGIMSGFINKIIQSLGSNKLTKISGAVCDRIDTPSAQLVKHGILMWYAKNLQIEEIKKVMAKPEFSRTAENIFKYQIVDHSKLHKIEYRKMQKIESEFELSSKKLIIERMKTLK